MEVHETAVLRLVFTFATDTSVRLLFCCVSFRRHCFGTQIGIGDTAINSALAAV